MWKSRRDTESADSFNWRGLFEGDPIACKKIGSDQRRLSSRGTFQTPAGGLWSSCWLRECQWYAKVFFYPHAAEDEQRDMSWCTSDICRMVER